MNGADHIVLTGIYAAGEAPLPGITIDRLAAAVRESVRVDVDVVERLDDLPGALTRIARPGDVVITLGAGSIGSVADKVMALLGGPR